jgi:hypothetical protein
MLVSSLIWLAVLAWLLYRQLQRRQIGGRSTGRRARIALVLLVLGAVEFFRFAEHRHFSPASIAVLVASFAVGAGLGVARGFTVRLTVEDGRLYRQGTPVTIALWLVAVGLHLASEHLVHHEGGPGGAGTASMLLYLAVALTVQSRVLVHRARSRVAKLRGAGSLEPAVEQPASG